MHIHALTHARTHTRVQTYTHTCIKTHTCTARHTCATDTLTHLLQPLKIGGVLDLLLQQILCRLLLVHVHGDACLQVGALVLRDLCTQRDAHHVTQHHVHLHVHMPVLCVCLHVRVCVCSCQCASFRARSTQHVHITIT